VVAQWSDADLLALARPAVAAAGPDELPLLEATVAAAPRPWTAHSASRSEDMLGFGWDESLPAVTIAAVAAAQAVLAHLAEQAQEEAVSALGRRVKALVRRRLGGRRPVAPLDPEQLRLVRRVAEDKAGQAGLDHKRAALIADAIVGQLAATATDEQADR